MIKGFRQIAIITVISRTLGMIRDMAYSYFLGAGGLMDVWAIAFKIPNLARRIFGEGAASSSFIPIYSEQLRIDPKNAAKLACTVVTVVAVILAALVLLGQILIWAYYHFCTEYAATEMMLKLASIMLPYMILICVVAILAGILNTHRHFATPAAAPLVLNIFIIFALCFTGWGMKMPPQKQVFIIAIAVIIAGFVQLLMQIPALKAKGITIRPAWQIRSEPFKKIIFLMGPMIIGLTVTQINTLSDDILAKCLSGSLEKGQFFYWFAAKIKYPLWDGAVSQLYYSQRLYQFPLGVLGISLATAIFPVMADAAAKKDHAELIATIAKGLRAAVFVAIPATAGLILVARPLAAAIFQHGEFTEADTNATARILIFYAIGLCGFFAQQIVTRAFFAIQNSKIPMKTALLSVFANIILNLILIWFMAAAGLALSTAICAYLQVGILIFMLKKRFSNAVLDRLALTLFKTLIATAIMTIAGVLILYLCRNLPQTKSCDIIRLALIVPSTTAVYFIAAKALKMEMLSLITARKHNRSESV